MLNQFTGASTKTLEKRLVHLRKALDDFYADPDAGGGGSPTEGMRERIEYLEIELERRKQAAANDVASGKQGSVGDVQAMTPEEQRAFDALVSTYRIWRDKKGITHAERTSALQALSSVINELGWWKEAQNALIEKRR